MDNDKMNFFNSDIEAGQPVDYFEQVDSYDRIDVVRIDVQDEPDYIDHNIIKITYNEETNNVDTYYIFTSGQRMFSTPIPQKLKEDVTIKDVIKSEIRRYNNIKNFVIEGVKGQ